MWFLFNSRFLHTHTSISWLSRKKKKKKKKKKKQTLERVQIGNETSREQCSASPAGLCVCVIFLETGDDGHVDANDPTYQWCSSWGTNQGGLIVDEGSHGGQVVRLRTHDVMAKFDGRFRHWNEEPPAQSEPPSTRFSVVFYIVDAPNKKDRFFVSRRRPDIRSFFGPRRTP